MAGRKNRVIVFIQTDKQTHIFLFFFGCMRNINSVTNKTVILLISRPVTKKKKMLID